MKKFNKGTLIIGFIITIYIGMIGIVSSAIFNVYDNVTTLSSDDEFIVWPVATGAVRNIQWHDVVTQMFLNPFDIPLAQYYMLVGDSGGLATSSRVYGRIFLGAPDICGVNAIRNITSTSILYNHCTFDASTATNNYIEWFIVVPYDMDLAVDPVGEFRFSLGGSTTDILSHSYTASMCTAASSTTRDCTPATAISLPYTPDAGGAAGDMERTDLTTLTGWGTAMANTGRLWRVRVTRGVGTDASSTVSTDLMFILKYAIKPGS